MSAPHCDLEGDPVLGDQPAGGVHVQGLSGCSRAGPPVPDAHSIGAGDPGFGIRG